MDWKTIYAGSSKSQQDSTLITDDLYSDPVQVSAYVGAVNADPRFSNLPSRVEQGALVCVFEDGRDPQVVTMRGQELEVGGLGIPTKWNDGPLSGPIPGIPPTGEPLLVEDGEPRDGG